MPVERAFSSDLDTVADLKRLYDEAARLTRMGAWACDLATERLTWTHGVFDLFELVRDVAPQRRAIVEMYVGESGAEMQALRSDAIQTGLSFSLDAQIRTALGSLRWMRLTGDVAYENGQPVRLFGAKQDITHERALWDELRRLAECDPLTGLANRRTFEARCDEVIRAAAPSGVRAVALVDLDQFKPVNDLFGHGAGDACLREVARRLTRAFDPQTLVARLGGDEFAVLFRAAPDQAYVERRLERAAAAVSHPMIWAGRRLQIGASIGVAMLAGPRRRKVEDMLADADEALYIAKRSGRNTIHVFKDGSRANTVAHTIASSNIKIPATAGQVR